MITEQVINRIALRPEPVQHHIGQRSAYATVCHIPRNVHDRLFRARYVMQHHFAVWTDRGGNRVGDRDQRLQTGGDFTVSHV